VCFSPDGSRVLSSSSDDTAKLWDASTGELLVSLDGHTNGVRDASFSRDGSRVVTASWDNTAKVWDASTGRLVASLDGHTHWVPRASFSPDGSRIVTASKDGTAKLWDVHLETRAPAEISDLIRRRVPWRLERGVLLPVEPAAQTSRPVSR